MTSINPHAYRALVLAQALKLLSKGIQPNRNYTWASVLRTANAILGTKYTRNTWEACADALQAYAQEKANVRETAGN